MVNQTYYGDHFATYTNTESLSYTSETHLYVNSASIKKIKNRQRTGKTEARK